MNKQQEALKLALEALEEINKLSIGENAICLPAEIDTAMDAIREALADSALERMAENARELGLDYEPAQQRPQNCGTGYCSCIECPYEQPTSKQ